MAAEGARAAAEAGNFKHDQTHTKLDQQNAMLRAAVRKPEATRAASEAATKVKEAREDVCAKKAALKDAQKKVKGNRGGGEVKFKREQLEFLRPDDDMHDQESDSSAAPDLAEVAALSPAGCIGAQKAERSNGPTVHRSPLFESAAAAHPEPAPAAEAPNIPAQQAASPSFWFLPTKELRARLAQANLDTSGDKTTLVRRLLNSSGAAPSSRGASSSSAPGVEISDGRAAGADCFDDACHDDAERCPSSMMHQAEPSPLATPLSEPFGVPGLKIQKKWLEAMRSGKKTVELRTYDIDKHLFAGQEPIRAGASIYLLLDGAVWGMADYVDTTEYGNIQEAREAENLHAVDFSEGNRIATALRERLQTGGKKVFGWTFEHFRWFEPKERPQSGQKGVPPFKGQRCGQVWSKNLLPANLGEHLQCAVAAEDEEAEPAPVEASGDHEADHGRNWYRWAVDLAQSIGPRRCDDDWNDPIAYTEW